MCVCWCVCVSELTITLTQQCIALSGCQNKALIMLETVLSCCQLWVMDNLDALVCAQCVCVSPTVDTTIKNWCIKWIKNSKQTFSSCVFLCLLVLFACSYPLTVQSQSFTVCHWDTLLEQFGLNRLSERVGRALFTTLPIFSQPVQGLCSQVLLLLPGQRDIFWNIYHQIYLTLFLLSRER